MSVKDSDENEIIVSLTHRVGGEYRSVETWRKDPKTTHLNEPSRKALCLSIHDKHGNDVCSVHLERTKLRAFLREALAIIDAEGL